MIYCFVSRIHYATRCHYLLYLLEVEDKLFLCIHAIRLVQFFVNCLSEKE